MPAALPRQAKSISMLRAGQNVGATEEAIARAGVPFAALSLGVVAALHELSSILYAQGEWSAFLKHAARLPVVVRRPCQ